MIIVAFILGLAFNIAVLLGLTWLVDWAIGAVGLPFDPTFWQVFLALAVLDLILSVLGRATR